MDALKIGELFSKLKPRIIDLISIVGGGTGPFAPTPHDLNSAHHTGTVADAQATQFLKTDGTRQLTGNLAVANGITIDGVDLSAHAGSVNAHHEPVTIADTPTINLSLSGQQLSASVIQTAVDHGSIGGLADDDHPQYYNAARHTLLVHTNLGLVPKSRQIISGDGILGGGDLSADRTLAVGAGTGISVEADSVGIDLAANLTWSGDHAFQGGLSTRHLTPELTDTYDLGSSTSLWRKGWISELESILLAHNSISLLGGWLLITKDEGALAGDVLSTDTQIDFGKAMTVGDFVLLRISLQMEYIQIDTLIGGTTYNVTRDLDGSGANDWAGGTPFAVLGTFGNGRIELNAYDSPRISILEQGATYNAQTERIRIGDLAAWQSAGLSGYGMALGDYAGGEYLTYSPAGGLVVRGTIRADDGYLQNLTVQGLLNLSTAGELRAGDTSNGLRFGYLSDGYYLRGIGSGTTQVEIRASDGKLYAGGGEVIIDQYGIQLPIGADPYIPQEPQAVTWYRSAFQSAYIGTGYQNPRTTMVLSAGQHGDSYGKVVLGAQRNGASPYEFLDFSVDAYDFKAKLTAGNSLGNAVLEVEGNIEVKDKYYYGYGNITFAGALKSAKNAASYTGYIYVPLTTPLTSTAWDGDARSTLGKTLINFRSVFGVPDGAKAIYVESRLRDSGSANSYAFCAFSPNTNVDSYCFRGFVQNIPGDSHDVSHGIINLIDGGNAYYQTRATGTNTLDVWLEIWGYWI